MRLIVRKHDRPFEELILEKESARIGRLETSDVVLDGSGISRFHAVVERGRGGFAVTNMGTGTTFVDGSPVTRAVIPTGGSFQIGAFSISVFEVGELEVLRQVLAPGEDDTHPCIGNALWSASQEELAAMPPTGEINVRSELAKLQQDVPEGDHPVWTASEKELSEVPATGEIDVQSELAKLQADTADDRPLWTASEDEMSEVPATGEIDVRRELDKLQRELPAEDFHPVLDEVDWGAPEDLEGEPTAEIPVADLLEGMAS